MTNNNKRNHDEETATQIRNKNRIVSRHVTFSQPIGRD